MSHYSKRGSVKTPIPKKTEILSIFSELDSAKIPHDSNSLKLKTRNALALLSSKIEVNSNTERDLFVSKVESFLLRAIQFMNKDLKNSQDLENIGEEVSHNSNCSIWPGFFYKRLVASETLLTHDQVEHYKEIISAFTKIALNRNAVDYKTAIEVFAYLETHSIDPDNSLCGLEPSRDVIRSSQRELEELSQKDSSREVLINKIISWGENLTSKDHDVQTKVIEEIQKTARLFKSITTFHKGELVIYKTKQKIEYEPLTRVYSTSLPDAEHDFFRYGRVLEDRGNQVLVSFTPQEKDQTLLSRENVLRLSGAIKDSVISGSRSLERMVTDPSAIIRQNLITEVQGVVLDYLVDIGIISSKEAAERWKKGDFLLDDKIPLLKCKEKLRVISDQLSTADSSSKPLFQKIDDSNVFNNLNALLTSNIFFIPTKNEAINSTLEFAKQKHLLVQKTVRALLIVADLGLSQIENEMKDFKSGAKKQEMTLFWHKLIQTQTDKFLISYNYDMYAIPKNYIDEPPNSLVAVKANLKIIKEILTAYNSYVRKEEQTENLSPRLLQIQKDLISMVQTLKKDIYERLDKFVSQANLILKIESISSNLQSNGEGEKSGKEADTERWLETLHKDIQYIEQMKILEEVTTKVENKDVVPISGLILNRFLRLENEIQTVLEVWSH